MTEELKLMHRQRTREFSKHGKSVKYLNLTKSFESKLSKASKQFLEKNVDNIMQSKPGQAYRVLKRMGAQPGDNPEDGSFTLPEYVRLGLSAAESADRLAQTFADISQEFPPLVIASLPPRTQAILEQRHIQTVPYISRQNVEVKLSRTKASKGGVPGDLPTRLIKEFATELSVPVSQIFRAITNTGKWPKRWRVEQGLTIKKTTEPQNEDDCRIISLTPFFSKQYEQFILEWLLFHISDKMDHSQYGGRRGTSTNHYLIDFISFILYNQDLTEPLAVLAAMVDFKKAFNRQNHLILITLLGDMGVPGWLLNLVVGFLQERELILSYKGAKSGVKEMPGGGPQGTVLGMFLFIILINSAGFKEVDLKLGENFTRAANAHKIISRMHAKYVDDLTVAEALKLKDVLYVENEKELKRPLNYHERTEHKLKDDCSEVEKQLKELEEYAITNEMKINQNKTKLMLFNPCKIYDFQPELSIDGVRIEVVKEMKLLGIIISDDLKWHSNTAHITKKAYSRLWVLRRLKKMGASRQTLVDVFLKQVRSVLEYAAVVWDAGLTKDDIMKIERVQKSACSIILGANYNSYEEALNTLQLKPLSERRRILAKKFAVKSSKHPIHSNWFIKNPEEQYTRLRKPTYKPVCGRTGRFLKSAIPYLTSLLNEA